VAHLLFRILTVILGVAFGLVMFVLALFGLLALLVWSLLRGRKPVVDLSGVRRAGRRMAGGEVVDVEAREVPAEPHQRLADSSSKISP
jgi:hypothetical protein